MSNIVTLLAAACAGRWQKNGKKKLKIMDEVGLDPDLHTLENYTRHSTLNNCLQQLEVFLNFTAVRGYTMK